MKHLLDTDTCVYALKRNASVLERLLSRSRSDIAVSVITEAELRTGAAKSSTPEKTSHLLENFLRPLTVVEFTSPTPPPTPDSAPSSSGPARPSGRSTPSSQRRRSPGSSSSSPTTSGSSVGSRAFAWRTGHGEPLSLVGDCAGPAPESSFESGRCEGQKA